jgi:deazaflavin-dependent oxidoreductase (nitroreductase family)
VSSRDEKKGHLHGKTYQINAATRARNALIIALLRAGLNMGTTVLLTVRGRKSGEPHTVPVTLVVWEGQRLLVAPYGEVQWVRNLRAAGTAILARRRSAETITASEILFEHQAAPVLKQYLARIAVVRPFFDVAPDAPLEAFESETPRLSVFLIRP